MHVTKRLIAPMVLSTTLATLATTACGGSDKPKAKSADEAAEKDTKKERYYNPDVKMMAEIGALPEEAVVEAFRASMGDLQRCVENGADRVEFLGGEIEFYIKVDQNRSVQHIHAAESNLGDRETELCMFDVLRRADWPAPVDGRVGIATNSFAFDMFGDVRPPEIWDGGRVLGTLNQMSSKLRQCKSGHDGQFTATMYINTDGSVMSASVTPPDESGEDAVDCLISTLKHSSYESPGSWPAKVSFYL